MDQVGAEWMAGTRTPTTRSASLTQQLGDMDMHTDVHKCKGQQSQDALHSVHCTTLLCSLPSLRACGSPHISSSPPLPPGR